MIPARKARWKAATRRGAVGDAGLQAHLAQLVDDPGRVDVVGAARGAGLAGEAEPDGLVGQRLVAPVLHDEAHDVVGTQVGLRCHRTPGGTLAALVAAGGVDAGGREDVCFEGAAAAGMIRQPMPAAFVRDGASAHPSVPRKRRDNHTCLVDIVGLFTKSGNLCPIYFGAERGEPAKVRRPHAAGRATVSAASVSRTRSRPNSMRAAAARAVAAPKENVAHGPTADHRRPPTVLAEKPARPVAV